MLTYFPVNCLPGCAERKGWLKSWLGDSWQWKQVRGVISTGKERHGDRSRGLFLPDSVPSKGWGSR